MSPRVNKQTKCCWKKKKVHKNEVEKDTVPADYWLNFREKKNWPLSSTKRFLHEININGSAYCRRFGGGRRTTRADK